MSDKLIIVDPNRINNNYLDVSKLNIDVRLETIKKEKTTIIASNGNNTIGGRISEKVDFLSGSKVNSNPDKRSLSTLFTEIGNDFDVIGENNKYQDLETLGITEINIDFNSSNVPIVTMSMIDIRGRLFQQGNNSPMAVFFEMPYPIFRLTVKGFVGKAVTYDLHLVKFTSDFNSEYGGFEIKCNFIGYKYAFLSDMLIGYLRGCAYTDIGEGLLKKRDYNGTTFEGFRQHVKDFRKQMEDFNLNESQVAVDVSKSLIRAYNDLSTKISDIFYKDMVEGLVSDGFRHTNETVILYQNINKYELEIKTFIDYVDTLIEKHNENFPNDVLSKINDNDIKYGILSKNHASIELDVVNNSIFLTKQDYHQDFDKLGEITENLSFLGKGKFNVKTITIHFLLEEIKKRISVNENIVLETKPIVAKEFSDTIESNGLDLGIGHYFKVLTNHVDVLMESIKQIAHSVENDSERNSQFKDISLLNYDNGSSVVTPFPEYRVLDSKSGGNVEAWIGNIKANGKTIPEVEFVEQLIKGMIKAKKSTDSDILELNAPLLKQISTYTPIHPIDNPLENPYQFVEKMNNINELIGLIYHRISLFLMSQNIGNDISDELADNLMNIEVSNLKEWLDKNEKVKRLFLSNLSDIEDKIVDYFISGKNTDGDIELVYPKYFTYGAYIRNKKMLDSDDISDENYQPLNLLDYEDRYVLGQTRERIPNGFNIYGFEDTNEFIELNSPIKLLPTNIIQEDSIVKPHEVLTTNPYNVSNATDAMTIPFNTYYGYPFFNQIDGYDSVVGFYNNTSVTPNDIGIHRHGHFNTIFSADLFRFQRTNEAKAMIMLMSMPLGLVRNTDNGNLSDKIFNVLNNRSGVVKANFLWCAWIGMVFKIINKTTPTIRVSSGGTDLVHIVNSNDYTIDTNGDKLWKFHRDNNEIRMPYNSDNKSMSIGSYLIDYNEYMKLSELYSLFNDDTRKMFIDKYDEYFKLFVEMKLGDVRVFSNQLNTLDRTIKAFTVQDYEDEWFKTNAKILKHKFTKDGYFSQTHQHVFDFDDGEFGIDRETFGSRSNYNYYRTKLKEDSSIYASLMTLMSASVMLVNTNANFWKSRQHKLSSNTIDKLSVNSNAMFMKSNLSKCIKGLIKHANSLKEEIDLEDIDALNGELGLQEYYGFTNSDDLRLKVYKDIKAIYDKWISGESSYQGEDDVNLYNSFKFIDRTYTDISEDFKLNIFTTITDLYKNFNQPLYAHISKVLSDNNFNFLPMPAYVDLSDENEVRDMFIPRYYDEAYKSLKPTFMCMYVGEYSNKLDLGENARFRSDGIEMQRIGDSLTVVNANDFNNGGVMPIVLIRYGDENQSIFKTFNISQSEFSLTNESLKNTENITTNNGFGQNLFDIYASRSYTINITALGNSMIQPFMYVYLEGVPMFYGLYLITKVNHNLKPNTMETNFTAVRMRNTLTKLVDVESMYEDLFTETYSSYHINDRVAKAPKGGVGSISGQGYTFEANSPFKNMINREIVNTTGLTMSTKNTNGSDNISKYVLDETYQFLLEVGKAWSEHTKNTDIAKNLVINSASNLYGGSYKVHSSHKIGTSIDIRPITNNGTNEPTTVSSNNYSHNENNELVKIINKVADSDKMKNLFGTKKVVRVIYFNDSKISGVTNYKGHHNHLHIELNLPEKYKQYSTNNGYVANEEANSTEITKSQGLGDRVEYMMPNGFTNMAKDYYKFCGQISNFNKSDSKLISNEVKAIMDVISFAEGTMGRGLHNGYDVLFGGVGKKQYIINGFTENTNLEHKGKEKWIYRGNITTTASGRYQFLQSTWIEMNKSNKPFNKYNQDLIGGKLVTSKTSQVSLSKIKDEESLKQVLLNMSKTWTSFKALNRNDKLVNIGNLYSIYTYSLDKYKI